MNRSNKCPQCGAVAPLLSFSCDFCGSPLARQETGLAATPEPRDIKVQGFDAVSRIQKDFGGLFPKHRLRKEVSQIPDSPEALVSFFATHIGGVDDGVFGKLHSKACHGALTKLAAFTTNDGKLRGVVRDLERQYFQKQEIVRNRENTKRKTKLAGCSGCLVVFVGVVVALIVGEIGSNREYVRRNLLDATALKEVQQLVENGRYGEARVRARDLDGEWEQEKTIKMIDAAEMEHNEETSKSAKTLEPQPMPNSRRETASSQKDDR
jgi:hypothetical protein